MHWILCFVDCQDKETLVIGPIHTEMSSAEYKTICRQLVQFLQQMKVLALPKEFTYPDANAYPFPQQ